MQNRVSGSVDTHLVPVELTVCSAPVELGGSALFAAGPPHVDDPEPADRHRTCTTVCEFAESDALQEKSDVIFY